MAQKAVRLDKESFSCSVCLDLLKDPVALPCGHSYCMNCIKTFWDEKKTHICPQCRQSFAPRPVLVKNTMLALLVEELKKTGPGPGPADRCYAGPEDVPCDFCTGRKLKALKSCLVCLVSYCEKHLQPHYDVAALKKHKLVDPSKRQENICSYHNEVLKMFCRTDEQCICYLCCVDEHKGHDVVSAAAERKKMQQSIQDRQRDVKVLQREEEDINRSADKAVEDSEKIFSELTCLIEKRSFGVTQQIRSLQKIEVSRVKKLQEKLKKDISELERKDAELKQLSDDHEFQHNCPSLSQVSETTDLSNITVHPLRYFEDVTASVSEVRDRLQDILSKKLTNISLAAADMSHPEPQTRAELLKYSCEIRLDPNTANTQVLLSNEYLKATRLIKNVLYVGHPDRFIERFQVLSSQSLTGRHYWEVEWRVKGINIAVAYRSIRRSGSRDECGFGLNDKSWALDCSYRGYEFWCNSAITPIHGPHSYRIGVYLDHRAGVLSFYSVSQTMTLLHRVQTTFTEPLYAGLWLRYSAGDAAEFCKLK